ncbi:terminase family protein [Pseudovibrio exalbescens]|uniref:DNA-packaging protein n=1 Tax=Pseudovibrio exalbescens TaxID=197461 RepID=UPI002366E015|nr:terminase family protein [Pseudovibrio exalbescens]MDD7909150.1 terminase family protein [Pseudovibrio exalbescens]
MTTCETSLQSALRTCVKQGKAEIFLDSLSSQQLRYLQHAWDAFAHPHQLPPEGHWRTWLIMGGRGAGKTRAGAEWVRALATGKPWAGQSGLTRGSGQIALVGQTYHDVREVMVEGISGVMQVHPRHERPSWSASRRRLEWPNGVVARCFSSEDPEALRGPQFAAAWCDELAKWRYAQETYDMLQFGLRLGEHPRQLITTTPRVVPLLRKLLCDKESVVTRASTMANAGFLAPSFLEAMIAKYGGTRLGRQELDGELISDREDGLFLRKWFELGRVQEGPEMERIVVAIDPPASATKRSDACGIVAAGTDPAGTAYILRDRTSRGQRPNGWAKQATDLYHELRADCIVAEANQGGEMVREVLAGVDPTIPVKLVHATRSKRRRAEPVALLYEQGRVYHVGLFPELEDEMADFAPSGLSSGKSPDRMDALVWALSELMLTARKEPRMRAL